MITIEQAPGGSRLLRQPADDLGLGVPGQGLIEAHGFRRDWLLVVGCRSVRDFRGETSREKVRPVSGPETSDVFVAGVHEALPAGGQTKTLQCVEGSIPFCLFDR